MKRTFSKQGLLSLVAGFFLFGFLMLTANSVQAQSYNWKQADAAQAALVDEMVNNIMPALPNLTGQQLNDTKAKVYYYRTIYHQIADGVAVGTAAMESTSIFNDPSGSFPINEVFSDVTVSKALKQQLLDAAILLLTN